MKLFFHAINAAKKSLPLAYIWTPNQVENLSKVITRIYLYGYARIVSKKH